MTDEKSQKRAAARSMLSRAAEQSQGGSRRRGRTTVKTLGREANIPGLSESRNAEAARRGSARALASDGPRPASPPTQNRSRPGRRLPTPEAVQVCSVDGRRLTARLVVNHLGWKPGKALVGRNIGNGVWELTPATTTAERRNAIAEVADDRGRMAFTRDFLSESQLKQWPAALVLAAGGRLLMVNLATVHYEPTSPSRRRKAAK